MSILFSWGLDRETQCRPLPSSNKQALFGTAKTILLSYRYGFELTADYVCQHTRHTGVSVSHHAVALDDHRRSLPVSFRRSQSSISLRARPRPVTCRRCAAFAVRSRSGDRVDSCDICLHIRRTLEATQDDRAWRRTRDPANRRPAGPSRHPPPQTLTQGA